MKSFIKVFSVIFLPILLTLTIGFYLLNNIMVTASEDNLLQEMHHKWYTLSQQISKGKTAYPEFRNITQETSLRITIINAKGVVTFDSSVPKDMIPLLENHIDRPEIKKALFAAEGSSVRFSNTLETDMMYYAKRYDQETILRIAYPMTYLASLKKALTQQTGWLFLALTIIILILSSYFARRVSLPVQKLNRIADSIESGERLDIFPHFKDKTMSKIAGLIYRIYNSMLKKQDELSREQEKLSKIFSIMDQGVILLDTENTVLHSNDWINDKFEFNIAQDEHLYKNTTDIEVITFFSDITEQTSNTVLRKTLKERTYDIFVNILSHEKLVMIIDITVRSEYETFKTELIGNISHELKTPISMMMMYSETLVNNKNIDQETVTKFLNHIYAAANRLNNIINDVLELHKLESHHKTAFNTEPTDLTLLTEDMLNLYEPSQKQINIQAPDAQIHIAYEHIQSVLTNLIDNAIKYSEGSAIDVEMTYSDKMLQIDVADLGPLIPPSERKRIFERFYTRSQSRNKISSGTGLGLSIVKHIANIYSGNVDIMNNDQNGNTFRVTLTEKEI